MQSYIPIQRQAELHKIMRAIFDDYYYLSLISAQNQTRLLYYVTIFLSSLCSLCQSNNCLLTLHHETISTHHNSSNILFISDSIRPVQHRHADQRTPQGYAKTTQSTTPEQQPPCSTHQRRDSLTFTQIQTQTEQTDRLLALVSPLRHISVTSPFGYRRDPITKEKPYTTGLI